MMPKTVLIFITLTSIFCLYVIITIHYHDINKQFFVRFAYGKTFDYKTKLGHEDIDFRNNYGWQHVGYSNEEQRRLKEIAIMISSWHPYIEDNIPTIPAVSADGHLLVLSVAASRIRYGTMLTFIMVYPDDMKRVLLKGISVKPLYSHTLNLWCIFDDGSVTSAYSYDSKYGNDRATLIDCPITMFASDQLWRYNRSLRVYLASLKDKDRNTPIIKGYVTVPTAASISPTPNPLQLTLCTSPLQDGSQFLAQWVLFHFLVGVRRFVIYNTTDTSQHLKHTISLINRHYPDLIHIVQWNFSSLGLKDVLPRRYFQTEALHDCLIRYGDQSEWLGTLDLDEYIVPLSPYTTISDYLHQIFSRRIIGSVTLWSQFFCTKIPDKYISPENDTNQLVIERFLHRARNRYTRGREKYLYRPRFVQYLSIHHQIIGLHKQQASSKHIMLAHYAAMNRIRKIPGCEVGNPVQDISIKERFASQIQKMMTKIEG